MNRRQFLKISTLGGLGLIASFPVVFDLYTVQVNRYRVPIPQLPPQFQGFTIVHLTDLHYGLLVPLSFLRNVIGTANRLKGDVIVCTGDYVHQRNTAGELDKVWPLLCELEAPQGVYSVLGNHDHWADANRSLYWLERSKQNLHFRTRYFERGGRRLWIAGGGDLWEDHRNFDKILHNIPPEDCRIVLAHNPDSADSRFSERIDLMICGHTHGGQVNLPFYGTPFLVVNNKNYSFGLKANSKGQHVFISKGIGWGAVPLRFNCFPEIAVLELTCA